MTVETIFPVILILAALLTIMVAGFLYAFAIVAMPGLKDLTDREFIRAFQGMDGIIQNNNLLFILLWGGSAAMLLIAAGLGFGQLAGTQRLILVVSAAIYIVGVQVPTLAINVPLNNALQAVNVDAVSEDSHKATRDAFESRWNQWNQIRTVVSIIVSCLLLITLLLI